MAKLLRITVDLEVTDQIHNAGQVGVSATSHILAKLKELYDEKKQVLPLQASSQILEFTRYEK